MLAKMKQELETIRKLHEKDWMHYADALDIHREENERLRQRIDRVERERVHVGNRTKEGSRHETRRE